MRWRRDATTGPTFPGGGRRKAVTALALVGVVAWVAWWAESVRRGALVGGGATWVPALPTLAADFTAHLDHTARLAAAGVNPYFDRPGDLFCATFPYPPAVVRLFWWVRFVPVATAVGLWLGALACVLGIGAWGAWRSRRALGLAPGAPPLAAVAAAVLYSTPAVTALERGQCDPLVVLPLLASAWLLGGKGLRSELLAGGLLGATAWLKYYPGATLVGLVALRRWRGAAAFLVVAALIGWHDRAEVARSVENGRLLARINAAPHPVHPVDHSLTSEWSSLTVVRRVRLLRRTPPAWAALALIGPAVALVAGAVGRARGDARLVGPLFLWLTAAATYAMPYAHDYNLVPLILAALAVWDARDPVAVQGALVLLLPWWQPLALPLSGDLLFVAKLAGLYAVGASLRRRALESARDRSSAGPAERRHPGRPAVGRRAGARP